MRENALNRRKHQPAHDQVDDKEIEPEENAPIMHLLPAAAGSCEQPGDQGKSESGKANHLAGPQQQTEQSKPIGREDDQIDRRTESGPNV